MSMHRNETAMPPTTPVGSNDAFAEQVRKSRHDSPLKVGPVLAAAAEHDHGAESDCIPEVPKVLPRPAPGLFPRRPALVSPDDIQCPFPGVVREPRVRHDSTWSAASLLPQIVLARLASISFPYHDRKPAARRIGKQRVRHGARLLVQEKQASLRVWHGNHLKHENEPFLRFCLGLWRPRQLHGLVEHLAVPAPLDALGPMPR